MPVEALSVTLRGHPGVPNETLSQCVHFSSWRATNGSELERRVWDALRRIPVGTTASYKGVAHSLGLMDPRAAIDIGAANKENPVAIIVPCHRVIANDGQLKGYAGGVHRKKWLLNHEGALKAEARLPETARLPGL
jgi:methylated-DNA-[protein]-cysteine S-methyltransferase